MNTRLNETSRHSNQAVWCPECHLRIAPYDRRTVFEGHDYHRHCYKKMALRMPELVEETVPSDDNE
jgi:hypothetical protein